MQDCRPAGFIPEGASADGLWRLWGADRQALADCAALNEAKREAIRALQSQGAE